MVFSRHVAVHHLLLLLLGLTSVLSGVAAPTSPGATTTSPVNLYVSPSGDDSNPGSLDKPFRTPGAAAAAVASLSKAAPIFVNLRSGTYYLPSPLSLTASHSGGSPSTPVTWRRYPGDSQPAVLSAGTPVTKWSKAQVDGKTLVVEGRPVLTAPLPSGLSPVSFFVDDARQQIARLPVFTPGSNGGDPRGYWDASTFHYNSSLAPPVKGSYPDVDKLGFVYSGSDLSPDWRNLNSVRLVVFHAWTATVHNIGAVIPDNHTVLFDAPSGTTIGEFAWASGRRYVAENVFEGLQQPGNWWYDSAKQAVLYVPQDPSGAPPSNAVVPVLASAVVVQGGSNIAFANLTVAHSNALGREHGLVDVEDSSGVSFDRVEVREAGGSCMTINGDSSDVSVTGSLIQDCGNYGFHVVGWTVSASSIHVSQTIIDDTGKVEMNQPAGARLRAVSGKGSGMEFFNNHVSRSSYAGVMVGWQQGVPDAPGLPYTFRIQNNAVTDYGMGVLSDFGGLYVSSVDNACYQPGHQGCGIPTLLQGNVVYLGRNAASGYGSEGWYADEQAASVNVTQNLFLDVADSGMYNHCGNDHTQLSNVVAQVGKSGVKSCNKGGNPTWPNLPHGFTMKSNIINVTADATVLEDGSGADFRNTTVDNNVYWGPSTAFRFPNGRSFEEWRLTGNDTHSVLADPQFMDPDNGDFRPRPSSPAIGLGFQPYDWRRLSGVTSTAANPFCDRFSSMTSLWKPCFAVDAQ